MEIAALVTWIVAALGGFALLGMWLRGGGSSGTAGAASRFRPPLIFGHFLLAAIGLVLWIIYLVNDSDGLAWTATVVILVVAVLGFTMFGRWVAGGGLRRGAEADAAPPEQHFPVALVIGHGLFAATTVVLVLLTVLTES
jgi:manganese efflux pump family protein